MTHLSGVMIFWSETGMDAEAPVNIKNCQLVDRHKNAMLVVRSCTSELTSLTSVLMQIDSITLREK